MGGGLYYRTKKDNIDEYLEQNKGLCIAYGATEWTEMLVTEKHIDYICDRKSDVISEMKGISVVTCEQLNKLIAENGKRAVIIICVGHNQRAIHSIIKDLSRLNIEADVFDYFENVHVFTHNKFLCNGKEYKLFEHPFNCGYVEKRMTERSVELALAEEWLNECAEDVVEVGGGNTLLFRDESKGYN